nr:alpha/beta fold hydrolase [Desulfitobacterium hafniense]
MHNRIGCLIIHGFGGNINEVEPLISYLIEQGYKVMAPGLKGHTGKREDLKAVKYTEWIASAETDLLALLSDCKKVYIIGFSMGGLIAVNLGLKHRISGIVTLNTPIYYWNIKRIIINIASDLVNRDFKYSKRYINSSKKLPFLALLNFRLLLSKTKPKVKALKCPIFVAQAINDDTVRKS